MVDWFSYLQIGVATLAALIVLVEFIRARTPNDISLGATALVGVLLVVQVVVSIMQPLMGNTATGDPLEFWLYLIVAVVLPFAAGFWALIDRKRSANLVLFIVNLSVAVMLYRMMVIWG